MLSREFQLLCDHSGFDEALRDKVLAEIEHAIIEKVGIRYLFMVRYLKDTGKWNNFLAYARLIQTQIEGVK